MTNVHLRSHILFFGAARIGDLGDRPAFSIAKSGVTAFVRNRPARRHRLLGRGKIVVGVLYARAAISQYVVNKSIEVSRL